MIMKKYSIYFILSALVMLASCKKFDGSMNIDPNSPTKASGTQLIASAERWLSDISSSPYGVHYPQHLSNTSFTDNSRYTSINFDFSPWYRGPLKDLQTVLESPLDANEGPVANQYAVARILKAYFFWHITDRWGDVPYSEALKGKDIKNDIVFNGDINKWKKFGNTIHMLMALRLSKVDAAKGTAEFNKALANGIMASNADNFTYTHLADAANENYWYNSFTRLGRNWFAVSKPIVDFMQPLADPRLPVFANKNTGGNYVGLPYGLPGSTTVIINNFSLLGSGLRLQNSPVYLVTYAQALFAKAEAAKLGWIPGGDVDAKINYDLAITNSIGQWTATTSTAAAYLAQVGVVYDPANAIQQIATQRWVHLFLHGYEAWAEWRRTGFPVLVAAPGANGDQIPRREGYPLIEASNNTANYNAAVAAFPYGGTDGLNARVWWDKP